LVGACPIEELRKNIQATMKNRGAFILIGISFFYLNSPIIMTDQKPKFNFLSISQGIQRRHDIISL